MRHVSTYPFFNIGIDGPCHPQPNPDRHAYSKGPVKIGNDVWIGRGVTILPGVTVGNGAVIGTGAVVRDDIPSYGIAIGNPATLRGYRFDADIIQSLEQLAWWDMKPEFIEANRSIFQLGPVEFLNNIHLY